MRTNVRIMGWESLHKLRSRGAAGNNPRMHRHTAHRLAALAPGRLHPVLSTTSRHWCLRPGSSTRSSPLQQLPCCGCMHTCMHTQCTHSQVPQDCQPQVPFLPLLIYTVKRNTRSANVTKGQNWAPQRWRCPAVQGALKHKVPVHVA